MPGYESPEGGLVGAGTKNIYMRKIYAWFERERATVILNLMARHITRWSYQWKIQCCGPNWPGGLKSAPAQKASVYVEGCRDVAIFWSASWFVSSAIFWSASWFVSSTIFSGHNRWKKARGFATSASWWFKCFGCVNALWHSMGSAASALSTSSTPSLEWSPTLETSETLISLSLSVQSWLIRFNFILQKAFKITTATIASHGTRRGFKMASR